MQEKCYWGDPNYTPHAPLTESIETDVLVVGAGVAGLFTAYNLRKQGVKDIVVLEERVVGSGSTGRSAGMLTCECETASWSELLQKQGKEKAELYYDAEMRALQSVSELIQEAGIPCDFALRDYYLVAGPTTKASKIVSEFHTVQSFGDKPVWLEGDAFREELTTPIYNVGERMQQGISVDPMRFIQGVGKHLTTLGIRIYEYTKVNEIVGNQAMTTSYPVTFKRIVRAQGPAYGGVDAQNYITTIGLTAPLSQATLAKMALDDKDMFADMLEPSFFYGKVTGENRLMLGYGDTITDKQSAETELHLPHQIVLEKYLKKFMPTEELSFEYMWSGIFSLSRGELPIVEISPTEAVIAGMGSQIASVTLAEYVAHKFAHGVHPLDALFQPSPQTFSMETIDKI